MTPEDNPTSQSLKKDADDKMAQYAKLSGAAFDKAYADNEVAYHKTVNGALESTLIPSAQNPELKSLLETGESLAETRQSPGDSGHHIHMKLCVPRGPFR